MEKRNYYVTFNNDHKEFLLPIEHVSWIYYINGWYDYKYRLLTIPEVDVRGYKIHQIKEFKDTGGMCQKSLPCIHYMTITFNDGFKIKNASMNGDGIRKIQKQLNIIDQHFIEYDQSESLTNTLQLESHGCLMQ